MRINAFPYQSAALTASPEGSLEAGILLKLLISRDYSKPSPRCKSRIDRVADMGLVAFSWEKVAYHTRDGRGDRVDGKRCSLLSGDLEFA